MEQGGKVGPDYSEISHVFKTTHFLYLPLITATAYTVRNIEVLDYNP